MPTAIGKPCQGNILAIGCVFNQNNPTLVISVERTDEAILVKLPLDTQSIDIQQMLNYFEYVQLASRSKATQEQIDDLAREAKKGWWENNKERWRGGIGLRERSDAGFVGLRLCE